MKTRIVVSVHSTLSIEVRQAKSWRGKILPWFINRSYPYADAIVAVSTGVAEDLSRITAINYKKIRIIYNPVVTPQLLEKQLQAISHPWFQKNQPPVLLAVGRLTEQKDLVTLINAFAVIRKQKTCRLLILGEGALRAELEALIAKLKLAQDVLMPGFVDNPYAYMKQADVFVLSSAWEGLVTVLIEAMACGTPVVSTDCPSGSREILADGKFGQLVPVGDFKALAEAVFQTLEQQRHSGPLIKRANDFTQAASVKHYLEVLDGW